MNHDPPRPSNVLVDKLNIVAANLSHWAENDPTIPFPFAANAASQDDGFLHG